MADIQFCPYCGHRTIDDGPQRTYCTTCGEDVATPEQLEDLRDEVAILANQNKGLEKDLVEAEDALEKEEARVLALYEEIETHRDLLADCREALEAVITGPVNLPARITEKVIAVHRRLL